MGDISPQDKITIGCLAGSVAVTAIILVITIYQFVRYRRREKKKLEDERKIQERRGLQWTSRDVPYRLGEDAFPSTYPDYPGYRDYPAEYPAIEIVEEIPIEIPVGCPEPRARFFPIDDSPYPMRSCIEPPPMACDCEPEPQEQCVIFEPVAPAPPPEQPQVIVYQPLPRDPPPPPREIVREIYFPSQPQPQPPPPPRERRGSWGGPSNDDWILVKKEVTRKKPKKVVKKVEDSDDSDSDSSCSSSDDEDHSPYNRRLMPYDLAMPRMQFPQPQMQFPQPQMQMPPVPPIYFIPQQPAPVPAPAPPPPAPAPAPVSVPRPAPRNAFFAANVNRFDSRQYEVQEQRANVATENFDCDDCHF